MYLIDHVPPKFADQLGCSQQAAQLLWHGITASTRRQYYTACAAFQAFCFRCFGPNHGCLPASGLTLMEWIAELSLRGRSYHTIRHRLTILNSWHSDLGLDVSTFSERHVRQMLRGFKHLYGIRSCSQKLPITLPILHSLLEVLGQDFSLTSNKCATFAAAFTLTYSCLLHCGEFTWSVFDPSSTLQVSSVCWFQDHAVVRLPRSKTDPFSQGTDLVVPHLDSPACPFTALLAVCVSRSPRSPLFGLGDSSAPFTRSQFIAVLRSLLKQLGLPASAYASHSFRQGAASWASHIGAPAEVIQELGWWNSDCY